MKVNHQQRICWDPCNHCLWHSCKSVASSQNLDVQRCSRLVWFSSDVHASSQMLKIQQKASPFSLRISAEHLGRKTVGWQSHIWWISREMMQPSSRTQRQKLEVRFQAAFWVYGIWGVLPSISIFFLIIINSKINLFNFKICPSLPPSLPLKIIPFRESSDKSIIHFHGNKMGCHKVF